MSNYKQQIQAIQDVLDASIYTSSVNAGEILSIFASEPTIAQSREQQIKIVTKALRRESPGRELSWDWIASVAVDALTFNPKSMEELVERAAYAINEKARGSQGARWNELDETERIWWREAARTALETAHGTQANE